MAQKKFVVRKMNLVFIAIISLNLFGSTHPLFKRNPAFVAELFNRKTQSQVESESIRRVNVERTLR